MINRELIEALQGVQGLALRTHEPMSRHTTWRVGGAAEIWLVPETEQALREAVAACRAAGEKTHGVVGQDLLISDGGLEGIWLRPGGFTQQVEQEDELLRVGALYPLAALVSFAHRKKLSGLEACSGRSGTVGEALAQGALAKVVQRVRVLRGSRVGDVSPERVLASHLPLQLWLSLKPAPALRIQAGVAKALRTRRGLGPGLPGAMMLNPKKPRAGELVGEVGLCGLRLRGVRIGVREPNSIVNLGDGSAADIRVLQRLVRDRVKQQLGVELQPRLKARGVSGRKEVR